jgi:ferredoxin-NADP reductase
MKSAPWIQAEVAALENFSPDLRRITLRPADKKLFPAASAGAHIVLELREGDRTWRNPYSLTSPPGARNEYSIIVRRAAASRGGSAYIHDHLTKGEIVSLGGPNNLFWPATTARKHLMLAGGIGVTPFLSYMAAFAQTGTAYELHVRCRGKEESAFANLLSAFPDAHAHATGRATGFDAIKILRAQPLGTHLYLCGPDKFMAQMESAAQSLGWPSSRIHQEFFGASTSGQPFRAVLARAGLTLHIGPDQSLLDALEQAGIDAPCLCRGGACGECKLPVLQGEPDHRDHFLTPEERARGDAIMTCVSRAHSDMLVLDI